MCCIYYIMKTILEKLFSSKLRVSILSLFFSRPGEEFYPGEIATLIGENRGNVVRELANLETIGILNCRVTKVKILRKHYSINYDFLLYKELRSIFLKTTEAAGVLREVLSKEKKIDYTFIYGSVAAGTDTVKSDIDLMVIGDIQIERVSKLLRSPEEILGRNINPSVYTYAEFNKRRSKADPFISRLMKEPKIIVKEKDDWLQKITQ